VRRSYSYTFEDESAAGPASSGAIVLLGLRGMRGDLPDVFRLAGVLTNENEVLD
jgi:hypothetical protein